MKKDSIIIRIVISAFIILLLIIPLTMIQSLITERQTNRQTVIKEISQSWADSQIVAGPILCLVKDQLKENREGKKVLQKNKYYLLPESLNIKSEVYPEKRHRGIYEVVLWVFNEWTYKNRSP